MENNNVTKGKNNGFLLSEQVKAILKAEGFSSIFNYSDYLFFKRQCEKAFDKARAIADLFLSEANPEQNDFNDYVF